MREESWMLIFAFQYWWSQLFYYCGFCVLFFKENQPNLKSWGFISSLFLRVFYTCKFFIWASHQFELINSRAAWVRMPPPHRLRNSNTWSLVGNIVWGQFRRYGLTGRSMSPEAGCMGTVYNCFLLPVHYSSLELRCGFSASCSCYHACLLLSNVLVVWTLRSLEQ